MATSSIRHLRTRTTPLRPTADAPYRSGGADDPTRSDPLGIDAQTRGLENTWAARLATGSPIGPLPDPRWAGYFQTLADRGVDRIGPEVGEPRSAVTELQAGTTRPGTAGDVLDDVADSMSGQPGSIEALRQATRAPHAAPPARPVQPAAPRTATLPRDPTLAAARFHAERMAPGSLAALQRRTLE